MSLASEDESVTHRRSTLPASSFQLHLSYKVGQYDASEAINHPFVHTARSTHVPTSAPVSTMICQARPPLFPILGVQSPLSHQQRCLRVQNLQKGGHQQCYLLQSHHIVPIDSSTFGGHATPICSLVLARPHPPLSAKLDRCTLFRCLF